MNDTGFLKNFLFRELYFMEDRYRNNSHGTDMHFIGYMKNGRGILTQKNGAVIELSKGDMFYIPKGCRYNSHWIAEGGNVCFDSLGFLYFPTDSVSGYILQKIELDQEIFALFSPLSDSKELNSQSIGRLYSLLGALESRLTAAPTDVAKESTERMLMLMRADPHRAISDYAADCGISDSALYLYVRRTMGITPNHARQEVLCQKAIQLLETTNLSVEEICGKVGFSSSSYFRKVLKTIHGKTPLQIRKQAKTI